MNFLEGMSEGHIESKRKDEHVSREQVFRDGELQALFGTPEQFRRRHWERAAEGIGRGISRKLFFAGSYKGGDWVGEGRSENGMV